MTRVELKHTAGDFPASSRADRLPADGKKIVQGIGKPQ